MTFSGPTASGSAADPVSVLVVGSGAVRAAIEADEGFLVTGVSSAREGYQWLADQPGRIDCVVCSDTLPDMDGVRFLESVRATDPGVPFVLVATDGSEEFAADAVAADVNEYIPIGGSLTEADHERIRERTHTAVADAEVERRRRRRAAAFEGMFDDPDRFVWVLAPDGTIIRTNGAALDALPETESQDIDGLALWEGPWWPNAEDARTTIRTCVREAVDGAVRRTELQFGDAEQTPTTVDLTVRPIVDVEGTVDRVIVEGIDVTERAQLERELRASEELHRVTLNNMTDTVLVTDDDGKFTYICPNVHFIFGYSVEEIREMGTIDELLGDGLFDPDELEEEGVLTNIETTATDSTGEEHTLLVNIREVSIQGGTTLYSCRDITKRKERERALTELHRTSRGLLYAETAETIATTVTEDAAELLEGTGTAVYLFDNDDNVLQPVAVSEDLETLHGPLGPVDPQDSGLVGEVFVTGDRITVDDLSQDSRHDDPSTDLRSVMLLPLGDHGVFLAGADRVGAFDPVTEEIADLLAATAEAALDRVQREGELRERDRELQRQNRQLTRLNRTNDIIREIDGALIRADSREEIEHAVCELLTRDDRFAFAWIGVVDTVQGEGPVEPRAWAGDAQGYLDELDLGVEDPSSEPAIRTMGSGGPTVVPNVGMDIAAGTWRKAALSRGLQSVVSVPLSHEEFSAGVLTVYASTPDVFDETSRDVLYDLGTTIASAIRSTERTSALLDSTVEAFEYRIADSQCVLYELARTIDGRIELKGGAHPSAEGTRLLVGITEAETATVLDGIDEMVSVSAAHVVADDGTETLVQLVIESPFIGTVLADHGGVLRSFQATPDGATIVVDIPQSIDSRQLDDILTERYPDSALVAQRTRERSVMTRAQFHSEFLESVTERQLEVLQTAYYSGYFESPRGSSGESVAETLGISASAFYNHVRTVQSKLFSTLFDDLDAIEAPLQQEKQIGDSTDQPTSTERTN